MSQELMLRELGPGDEAAFLEGLTLWPENERTWHTFDWQPGMSHEDHLQRLAKNKRGQDIPDEHVPSSMLYGFIGENIIGRVSVRHRLNDFLLERGGHIGFAVAPPFRQQGYAKAMLSQGLHYCHTLRLDRVLLTCHPHNLGSRKAIMHCGGVLEDIRQVEDQTFERYWIRISNSR